MKYIRTKDGIYENNSDILVDDEETRIFILGRPSKILEIIKQADTIEELVDEYVWMRSIIEKDTIERIKKNGSDYTVYGAIWTDKGLIYVAKMNEKGELELL